MTEDNTEVLIVYKATDVWEEVEVTLERKLKRSESGTLLKTLPLNVMIS